MKRNSKTYAKISFFILGVASTVWFLIRVIPKPSRASYPCMKAAAPIMSTFIVYLLSLAGGAVFIRKGLRMLYRLRFLLSAFFLILGLSFIFFTSTLFPDRSYSGTVGSLPEDFLANIPYGSGTGIYPGRVVWAWNPDATDENCTNTRNDPERGEDGYFLEKNNNREVISRMLDDMVIKLTGTPKVSMAWDSLFTDLNRRKGIGPVTYQEGQKIFIKMNQGGGSWLTDASSDGDLSFLDASWAQQYYGMAETSPVVVIELLDQLVNGYGIPEENIYVGDPLAHIYKHNYDLMHDAFPDVKYVDKDINHADIGRTILTPSEDPVIFYSDKGSVMPDAVSDRLYAEMENADYLINVAALKAHAMAGVSLTTKNHFGSHTRDGAIHLHPGLIAVVDDTPIRTEYGMYRVHTDIMGHKNLGGNTVLFVVDGLWGGPEAKEKPVKWDLPPFIGDWPSSIFASQDQVALESVCFDFLRSEFTDPEGAGKARPWMGGVDDYLHQAADSQFWPEGITYDPEDDGIPIGSLGTHEHWNNSIDKAYSRNLGFDSGIELLSIDKTYQKDTILAGEARIIPVIDGSHGDRCWLKSEWHYIDNTWIPWGIKMDSTDFYGRYHICWSGTENLLYFYVEINDDHFVDGYEFPGDNLHDYDMIELYLDEDNSGGFHAFDDDINSDINAENAFTYHFAVDAPLDGETVSDFLAGDIHGLQWGDHMVDYTNHIDEFVMKKEGNTCTYEFSVKVYGDNYQHSDPQSSRVSLTEGKTLGCSLAYSDADVSGLGREQYFGSVWVPEAAKDDHWIDADYFGLIRLLAPGNDQNQAVEVSGTIPDYKISQRETETVIHENLNELFFDPDGDPLDYSVYYENEQLEFRIINNELRVWAGIGYEGETVVELVATDGEFEAGIEFLVFAESTGIIDSIEIASGIICYPNPFNDNLYLEFNTGNEFQIPAAVAIYNLHGQLIYSETFDVPSGSEATKLINLAGCIVGLYVLELEFDGITYSRIVSRN